MTYFFLYPNVLLIEGAFNGALYNLNKGSIFSISPLLKKILKHTEKEVELEQFPEYIIIKKALWTLKKEGLGFFSEENKKPKKLEISPPKPKLDMMWLALNSNCNLICEHCYATSEPGPLDGSLPYEYLFQAMKEAKEVFDLECLQLIGGEPLLLGKQKVTSIINEACRLQIPVVEVFTNGYLIDDFYLSFFKEKNVHVAISIYSNTPEEHDAVTQRKGSWEKTVNAIRRVKNAGLNLRAGIVAMVQNQKTVGNTASWLEEEFKIPFDGKAFDVVRSCGRGNNPDTIPWDLFKEQHIRIAPDFSPVSITSLETTMFGNICWSREICIMPNGDVTPCEMEFENIQGNIQKESLTDIILGKGGDLAQRLTKDKVEICKDCEYRYACWECRAMAHQLDDKRFSQPITCMYNPYTGNWKEPPNSLETFLNKE